MKKIFVLAVMSLLGLAAQAVRAGDCESCATGGCASGHCNGKCSCIVPDPYCPDCSSPCEHLRLPPLFTNEHAAKLIGELQCGPDCCARIKAAKKLGCRLHADFCHCSDIVPALVHALICDTCWEVRREAALALGFQMARVPEAVCALYIASKLDHHYMVRDGALMALDMIILGRGDCFKDVYKSADRLIPRIRKDYDPTNSKCVPGLVGFCSQCAGGASVIVQEAGPKGELIPAPKEELKGELIPAPKEEKKGEAIPAPKEN